MDSSKKVIMISGIAGSGKDTVANMFKDLGDFQKIAFADELKDHVGWKYGLADRLLYTQEGKRQMVNVEDKLMSVRDLLIKEATEKRKEDESCWARLAIYKAIESDYNIVISDFRFPIEYDELKKYFSNLVTVKVQRPYNLTEMIDSSTENQLKNFNFDFVIHNNSDINYLRHQVEILYKYFLF